MQSIGQFSMGEGAKGVACVGISPCQRYVAAADSSADHNMYIYNVQKKKMLLKIQGGKESFFQLQWSKKPNDLRFAVLSERNINFWSPADATKRLNKTGTFGSKFQQTRFNCVVFDEDGICYSGGQNGGIHVWDQKMDLGLVLKAHAGDITAISAYQGNLVSAGKDDQVSVFAYNQGEYKFVSRITLNVFSPVFSIDVLQGRLALAHESGLLHVMSLDGSDRKEVTRAHHDGEVWGLEVLPSKGTILTCGDDGEIYEYDLSNKKCLRQGKVWTPALHGSKTYELSKGKIYTASSICQAPKQMQGRAIAYSSKLNQVAVSNNYGDVMVLDYNNLERKICLIAKPKEWCEVLVYSPCHQYLAIGSHDDTVYIYKTNEDGPYSLLKAFDTFSSAILAIDWSVDSKFLRVLDQSYLKNFIDLENQTLVNDSNATMVDPATWASSTLKMGWESMGVYRRDTDGSDVNFVSTNQAKSLLVSADDFGSINVFRFPVVNNSHDCLRLCGHSEHVVRAKFLESEDGVYIVSVGGNDRAVIQWKQTKN
jgi:WD40 repeat protein